MIVSVPRHSGISRSRSKTIEQPSLAKIPKASAFFRDSLCWLPRPSLAMTLLRVSIGIRYYARRLMDEKEPTQRTEQGREIPVPTREQIDRDFAKIAKPVPPKPKKK